MKSRALLVLLVGLVMCLGVMGFGKSAIAQQDPLFSSTPTANFGSGSGPITPSNNSTSTVALNVELVGHGSSDSKYFENVTVSGGYAYLPDTGTGLHIFDVSDPATPRKTASHNTSSHSNDVAISANFAYLAHEPGLKVLELKNPNPPTEIGSLGLPEFAQGIVVAGNYAYLTNGNGLGIVDISDPTDPKLIKYIEIGATEGISIKGTYVYVAHAGLTIVDVSEPSNPIVRSTLTTSYAWDVTVVDDLAYLAATNSGLLIVDISNPDDPRIIGSYDTPGNASGVAVSGNLAYVADWDSGLRVINVSNPRAPYEVGYYVPPSIASRVAVSGNNIYLANAYGGLVVLKYVCEGQSYCLSDYELVNRYAPFVYMHQDDAMVPMSIELALEHVECIRKGIETPMFDPCIAYPPITSESLSTGSINQNDTYLDFKGDPLTQTSDTYFINNIKSATLNDPTAYAQIVRENGEIAIQYWLYYFYNRHKNGHEGDWEMVQIMIGSDGQPTHAAFSQHRTATKREWYSVEKVDGTHPLIYSAKGSHASYFYPAKYVANDSLSFFDDFDDEAANHQDYIPNIRLVDNESPPSWIKYLGHWGEQYVEPFSGPGSPGMQDRWDDPFEWFRNIYHDDDKYNTYHNGKKFILQGSPQCKWLVTDRITNKRWGTSNGVEYNEIPGVEAIHNSEFNRITIIFHESHRDYVRFEPIPTASECLPMPPPTPTPEGEFTTENLDGQLLATIQYVDSTTNVVNNVAFAYPENWDANGSIAHFSLLTSDAPEVQLDLNGDSGIDDIQAPIEIETSPLYTPPTADFATTQLSGSAPLNVKFLDMSSSMPLTWLWDFGDGNTSTEQNPTHIYSSSGTFSVTLFVTNPAGSDTISKSGLVTILPSITGFIPSGGAFGATVSIHGVSLGQVNEVRFNGEPATFEIVSDTQIDALVPSTATSGKISISSSEGLVTSTDDFLIIYPPDLTTNTYPGHGATEVPINSQVAWSATDPDNDPLTYEVHFGTTNPPPQVVAGQSATTYDPPGDLDYSTTYYWQIVASDGRGGETPGPVWSFTTAEPPNQPPNTPVTPNPAHNATNIVITATLSWSATDPDNDPLTHEVRFGTTNPPPQVVAGQSATTYDPPGDLDYSTTYYWQIVANDGRGGETPGPVWSFTTVDAPPPFPNTFYISPSNNKKIAGIAAASADILRYEKSTNTWTMIYDGSVRGTTKNVSAFDIMDDGSLLLVFSANQKMTIEDNPKAIATPYDVVKFTPYNPNVFPLGGGTFSWYFRGKDHDLSTGAEKIDAIDKVGNRLLLSTTGTAKITVSGVSTTVTKEDVLAYNTTTDQWESTPVIDGSAIPELKGKNISSVWDDPNSDDYYVTVTGAFKIGGVKGNAKSIVKLTPSGSSFTPSFVDWLAPGQKFPSNLDGLDIAP